MFSKFSFSKNYFRNTIRSANFLQFGSRSGPMFDLPDLGTKYFAKVYQQTTLADKGLGLYQHKSKQKMGNVKGRENSRTVGV